jgi:pilus assembly protein CpaB
MKLRVVILVLFAFGAALGTALFARNWLEAQRAAMNHEAPAAPPPSKVEVLVAKDALPAGTLLKPDMLHWQAWPEDGANPAYILKGKRKAEDLTGAVIRQGVAAGQPLTDGIVVMPGDSGFLAAVLDPGMRAVSVSINATTGTSGFIFPGDRVDVILTHTIDEPGKGEEKIARRASETILANVRVVAVDQNVNDQEEKPVVAKNVTLELTPKQAEIITLVGELGKLSLSLRSIVHDDTAPIGVAQADNNGADKKGGNAADAPAAAAGAANSEKPPTQVADRPRTYTWDSDASMLIRPPSANGHAVNVLHGEKAETQDFRSAK